MVGNRDVHAGMRKVRIVTTYGICFLWSVSWFASPVTVRNSIAKGKLGRRGFISANRARCIRKETGKSRQDPRGTNDNIRIIVFKVWK